MRPDWDAYFIGIAHAVSARADCSRKAVGALIVDENHRVVSTGYNGSPPGGPSCLEGMCPRAQSDVGPGSSYDSGPGACISVHAEANAIIFADYGRLKGTTMYTTCQPCVGCQRLIDGAGIKRVVVG